MIRVDNWESRQPSDLGLSRLSIDFHAVSNFATTPDGINLFAVMQPQPGPGESHGFSIQAISKLNLGHGLKARLRQLAILLTFVMLLLRN